MLFRMSFHRADRPAADEICGIACPPSAERPAIVMVRASPVLAETVPPMSVLGVGAAIP